MSTNFVIVMGLILIELTLVIASVLVYTLFRIAMRELKNTRCDYNFRMAKLQEFCESKSGVQQLITEQYKTLIEQYHDFHEVWKQSAEYYKELSEHYSVLEDRYSDIYEQYEQLNKRIEDLANAVKPEEIDLDEPSSIYWDPFYDRAEIDFSEEGEKTDES